MTQLQSLGILLSIQIERRSARERVHLRVLEDVDHTYVHGQIPAFNWVERHLPWIAAYIPRPHIESEARK